jgi:hypothetical protein
MKATYTKIRHKKRLKIWNEEIQNAVNEKKAVYFKLLNSGKTEHNRNTKQQQLERSRKLQNKSREIFINYLEKDVTGVQSYGFKVFQRLQEDCTDRIAIPGVTGEKWREHHLKLLHNGKEIKTLCNVHTTANTGNKNVMNAIFTAYCNLLIIGNMF